MHFIAISSSLNYSHLFLHVLGTSFASPMDQYPENLAFYPDTLINKSRGWALPLTSVSDERKTIVHD